VPLPGHRPGYQTSFVGTLHRHQLYYLVLCLTKTVDKTIFLKVSNQALSGKKSRDFFYFE
jgi:hypothetical protein